MSCPLPLCPNCGLGLVACPLSISVFCLSPPESHFLTKLHSLKMLSITPSQLENGKKITTYDYRCASPRPAFCRAQGAGLGDGRGGLGSCVRRGPASPALGRWRPAFLRGTLERMAWGMGPSGGRGRDAMRRGLQDWPYPRPRVSPILGLCSCIPLVNRLSSPVTYQLRPTTLGRLVQGTSGVSSELLPQVTNSGLQFGLKFMSQGTASVFSFLQPWHLEEACV